MNFGPASPIFIYYLMNRVGRLLICVAGALTLSVSSRADSPVAPTPNVNALRMQTTLMNRSNLLNRIMLMKKHRHMQDTPPGMPGLPQQTTPQAFAPQLNAPPSAAGNSVAASVPAKSDAVSDNPYSSIVTRNVFGLNPIPPQAPPIAQVGPPPPKITLTGITTIFGPAEALFKVAGVVRNAGPPKDESYIFTEGEAEDDVEVTKIDTQKNVVTFMNHGVEQEIALAEGTASSGSAPASPSWPGQMGGGRRPGSRFRGFPGGFQPQSPQPQAYGNPYGGGGGNNNSSQNGSNPSGMFNNNDPGYSSATHNLSANIPQSISQLSPEDQDALVAAQHAQMVQQGDPTAVIMPPTAFDQQAMEEAGKGAAAPGK